MKYLPLLVCLFFTKTTPVFAQISMLDTAYSVVTVSSAQNFYLDSRIISKINGHSRLALPVVLPENTVRWFYSFAATESKNEPLEWVSLAGQLTKIYDRTGIVSEAITRLVKPVGTTVCDVFVFDTEGVAAFEKRDDAILNFDKNLSRMSITGGIVEGIATKNKLMLGISNPSLKTGINVKIEVSAIVAKSTIIYNKVTQKTPTEKANLWTKMEREAVFSDVLASFEGKNDPSVSEVTTCVVQKVASNFTPDEFKNRSLGERDAVLSQMRKDCFSETKNEILASNLTFLWASKKQLDSLEQAGKSEELLKLTTEIEQKNFSSVANRTRHVRALILNNKKDEALKMADPMARLMPEDLVVQLNFAHSLLLNNQLEKAEKLYLKFKNKINNSPATFYVEKATWEEMVAADFKIFIKNKLFNSAYENIKRKLKIKE